MVNVLRLRKKKFKISFYECNYIILQHNIRASKYLQCLQLHNKIVMYYE